MQKRGIYALTFLLLYPNPEGTCKLLVVMRSLADFPDLIGFFSYSREDDDDSNGALSNLRDRIQRELRGQLGRTRDHFRLWQDKAAIAHGTLWEEKIKLAIAQSVFFIPIVTPTAVRSHHCKFEFELFLAREAELGRNDLIFPILYIRVPALENERKWREDDVLRIIGARQYMDWQPLRHLDAGSSMVATNIEKLCKNIFEALQQPQLSLEELQKKGEVRQRVEDTGWRQEAEIHWRIEKRADEQLSKRGDAKDLSSVRAEIPAPTPPPQSSPEGSEVGATDYSSAHLVHEVTTEPQILERQRLLHRWRGSLTVASLLSAAAVSAIGIWAVLSTPTTIPSPGTEFSLSSVDRPATETLLLPANAGPPATKTPVPPAGAGPPVSETRPGVREASAVPLLPERERELKPQDTFKECDTCPEMAVIPEGSFTMGSPESELERDVHEVRHRVIFSRPLAVGRFAVTFGEWEACLSDGGCNRYRPADRDWGRGNRPVIFVSWSDAKNYLAWLSRKTGKNYRLLTEAEREYVTRAGTTTPFWWGPAISTQQANYNGNFSYGTAQKGEYRQATVPVNSFAPNAWGLYQVHGNVWEWTEDCWNETYEGAPADGSAWTGGDCRQHVHRGGSWNGPPRLLRSAVRGKESVSVRHYMLGFRVARSIAH
jgi:formylglycine-generating enzyme required for sulfatase activity